MFEETSTCYRVSVNSYAFDLPINLSREIPKDNINDERMRFIKIVIFL